MDMRLLTDILSSERVSFDEFHIHCGIGGSSATVKLTTVGGMQITIILQNITEHALLAQLHTLFIGSAGRF